MAPSRDAVVILKLGAEGGAVTLWGRKQPDTGSWELSRESTDPSLSLSEEDAAAPVTDETPWTTDWNETLADLDRYPWPQLYPLELHPDFAERFRLAVEERVAKLPPATAAKARERWAKARPAKPHVPERRTKWLPRAPARPRVQPLVFRNRAQPAWGLGLVFEEHPLNWFLVFEHAGRKVFKKAATSSLVPETLDPKTFAALESRLMGRTAAKLASRPEVQKPSKAKRVVSRYGSFEEQLAHFATLFPGGFGGARFIAASGRGLSGKKGAVGGVAGSLALVKDELSSARFKKAKPEELFDSAARAVAAMNGASPLEGATPFRGLPKEARPAVVAALEALLFGKDEYPSRLEAFAGAVKLTGKGKQAKPLPWPLATVFGALSSPEENVCVRPKAFAEQAALFERDVIATQPVTAVGYRKFLAVAEETQRRLRAAGHAPRDLLDVGAFIERTNAGRAG